MTELNATSPPPPVGRRKTDALGLVREWFLRDGAIAAAPLLQPAQRVRRERARSAAQLGDMALGTEGPEGTLSDDASPALALSLYREAAFWALTARSHDAPTTLAEAFERAPEEHRSDETLRAALVDHTFVDTAELDLATQSRDALAASAFVHALLDALDARERAINERWSRVASLCVAVAMVTVGFPALKAAMRPGLAESHPWTASSAISGFPREGRGVTTPSTGPRAFFHTQSEPSPWVAFDLESRVTVRSVTLQNRGDCCQERAAPLVVELSDDGVTWAEVARRDDLFDSWTATFAPHVTRHVRVRATRTTNLHLANVDIR